MQVDDPIDSRHSEAVIGDKGYPVEQLIPLCYMATWDNTLTGNSVSQLTLVAPTAGGIIIRRLYSFLKKES